MSDATLSNVEEKITLRNKPVSIDEYDESKVPPAKIDDTLIPTAIVKPKYQKLSFDERQLPIRGETEADLWDELNNSTATITTTPRKVQKHLPKSQKHSRKLVNAKSNPCLHYNVINNDATNLNDIEKKRNNDCGVTQNSVAIVQPIKKESYTQKENICVENEKTEQDEKEIDYRSKNSMMNQRAELKILKSSVLDAANEIMSKNVCDSNGLDNNSLKINSRESFECEIKMNPSKDPSDRYVPTKTTQRDLSDVFDVYNIETALPIIDLEAIESHLMASAKEEELKRKNDRETIRRRLAMGEEDDYLSVVHRPIRKPNLQSRLQSGMNLQICFMNEAASDSESSDSETCPKLTQGVNKRKNIQRSSSLMSHRTTALNNSTNPYSSRPLSVPKSVTDRNEKAIRPLTRTLSDMNDNNFFTHQARLQIEARMALAQAKDMAHMQMEFERQKQLMCPITELVHKTLEKIGMKVPLSKRRLSRQMLTNMNIAQLQIVVNEFHSFIETLNELLVKFLMDRDDLSMRQDSMLIDIEDITRYLAEKEETELNNRTHQQQYRTHLDSKSISDLKKKSTSPTIQQTPTKVAYLQNNNISGNKKSLVVNGNGHSSVITSVSRENFEQEKRLHL